MVRILVQARTWYGTRDGIWTTNRRGPIWADCLAVHVLWTIKYRSMVYVINEIEKFLLRLRSLGGIKRIHFWANSVKGTQSESADIKIFESVKKSGDFLDPTSSIEFTNFENWKNFTRWVSTKNTKWIEIERGFKPVSQCDYEITG